MHAGLFRTSVHSIQRIAEHRSEQKGFYRFLKNDKVCEDKLTKELANRCGKLTKGKIVLSIQDTTEVNLFRHTNRIDKSSGVGDIADSRGGIGFMIHPSLVIDALSCFPLGFSDIKMWNRSIDMEDKHERDYKNLPIEDKESYKWVESSNKTKEALKEAKAIIIVQDREGDIFDQFADIPDEQTFLLIRSQFNRRTDSNEKLWTTLGKSTVLGQYELQVTADSRRNTSARTATIEVRGIEITIKRPKNNKKEGAKLVSIYAIEAKEINTTVKEPIHWRLATTWPVNGFEDCACVIEWYTWRWQIEELFRTLKKEGYNIEASELENGWAIRKLAIMMMDVIIKLMQMRIVYNRPEEEGQEAASVFSEQEQHCLEETGRRLEGKTKQLQNPYQPKSLKWAVWVIARLGGWKGYKSQRPPGLTTLQEGLNRFYAIFNGWSIQKDVGTR